MLCQGIGWFGRTNGGKKSPTVVASKPGGYESGRAYSGEEESLTVVGSRVCFARALVGLGELTVVRSRQQ